MDDTLSALPTPAFALPHRLFTHYAAAIRRHPGVALSVLASALIAGLWPPPEGVARFAPIAYPLAMLACAVLFDALLLWRGEPAEPVKVRAPGRETAWVLWPYGLGLLWLTWKFAFPKLLPALGFLQRPPFILGALLLLAPILQTGVLLKRGYRTRADFALSLRGVWIAPLLIGLIALTTWLAAPSVFAEGMAMTRRFGPIRCILMGFGMAAIPEEVLRYLMQTRLGALFHNRAAAWLLTGFLWSVGHVPVHMTGAFQSWAGAGLALMGTVGLMPIGLLWGYLTLRGGSLLPSVLIHGTNVWGLHNL